MKRISKSSVLPAIVALSLILGQFSLTGAYAASDGARSALQSVIDVQRAQIAKQKLEIEAFDKALKSAENWKNGALIAGIPIGLVSAAATIYGGRVLTESIRNGNGAIYSLSPIFAGFGGGVALLGAAGTAGSVAAIYLTHEQKKTAEVNLARAKAKLSEQEEQLKTLEKELAPGENSARINTKSEKPQGESHDGSPVGLHSTDGASAL